MSRTVGQFLADIKRAIATNTRVILFDIDVLARKT
jgi:hypothetical protein